MWDIFSPNISASKLGVVSLLFSSLLFSSLFSIVMSSFGTIFRVSTFGESHGGGVGCIVEGVPPRMSLSPEDIQKQLDRRRPGQSAVTTSRQELDRCIILSGEIAHVCERKRRRRIESVCLEKKREGTPTDASTGLLISPSFQELRTG